MAETWRRADVRWDELHESSSFKGQFRYRKDDRERTYKVKILEDHAELWVTSERASKETTSRKLATFTSPDDVAPFIQSIEQELRAGGWLEA